MEKKAHNGLYGDDRDCCSFAENGAMDVWNLDVWTRVREKPFELVREKFRTASILEVTEVDVLILELLLFPKSKH